MEEDVYYKGYKIKIRQDEFAESPDWGDENLFLVYDHRQFTVKREGFNPLSIYDWLYAKNVVDSNDDIDGNYQEEIDSYPEINNYWIFPVEAYIHSGVHLSLFSGTKQCMWDSSVSGYILASKEEFELEETARNASEGLIETWNQYLSGDIWGYIIEKPNEYYTILKTELDSILTADDYNNDIILLDSFIKTSELDHNWEEVDSCWGFYGQEAAINEAKLVIDNLIKE